jgi:thiosulfate dehydrogenase [quinone] large subunit
MVDIAKNHATAASEKAPESYRLYPKPDTEQQSEPDRLGPRHSLDRVEAVAPAARSAAAARYILAGIRIALGFVFLWAFLDKVFGWGFATTPAKSWIDGGNPTKGFLSGSKGPFSGFFHTIAGTTFANVMFMVALAAIGTALILGIGMRLAAVGGALLTVMMWAVVLPPANNPFLDEHLIYAAVLIVLALLGAGNTFGLGRAWSATPLVRRAPWLQ